jgi:putative glutamine amidotransferase
MNILDVGAMFKMPTRDVFKGTANEIVVPTKGDYLDDLLKSADLICFGGGEDVHPELYGCKNVASGVGHQPSRRDLIERIAFKFAVDNGIPMFGICRGAQLLCALSGGKLVQDVQGHGGMHTITTNRGEYMPMTSTHHQMMYPGGTKHELIAWTDNRSKRYTHDIADYVQQDVDPEVVFFKDVGALAVQGHPEWMDSTSPTVKKVREWIEKYLNVNL